MINARFFAGLSAIAFSLLTACAPAKNGDETPASPSPESSVDATKSNDYAALRARLLSNYGCAIRPQSSATPSDCRSVAYPDLQNQILLLEQAHRQLKSELENETATGVRRAHVKFENELPVLDELIADKKIQLQLFATALAKVHPRLSEIEEKTAKARQRLAEAGCGWNGGDLQCPSSLNDELESLSLLQRESELIAAFEELHKQREEIERSLPQPGFRAESSVREEARRARAARTQLAASFPARARAVWEAEKASIKSRMEPVSVLFDPAVDGYLPAFFIVTRLAKRDLERVAEAVEMLRAFGRRLEKQASTLEKKALDRIVVTVDETRIYDRRIAYDRDPSSGQALILKLSIRLAESKIADVIRGLDAANNAKWRARAARLSSIASKWSSLPFTDQGLPLTLTVQTKQGLTAGEFHSDSLQILDEGLDVLLKTARLSVEKQNLIHGRFPRILQLNVILGTTSSCRPDPTDPDALIYETASVKVGDLSSCLSGFMNERDRAPTTETTIPLPRPRPLR